MVSWWGVKVEVTKERTKEVLPTPLDPICWGGGGFGGFGHEVGVGRGVSWSDVRGEF